jgi:TldD protein
VAASIDPHFALPLDRLADTAWRRQSAARRTDFRVDRLRTQTIVARDQELQTVEGESVGFSLREVCKGAWGFAAGIDLAEDAVASVARRAVEVAEALAPLNTEPVVLADEPAYVDTYVSSYEIDPFSVPEDEKIGFLLALNERALATGLIDRVTSHALLVREQKYFASLAGSRIAQQRVRVKGDLTAVRIDKSSGAFETMGSAAPPAGRGWEYFTRGYDFSRDADEIPALLEEKMASASIEPGLYDVVIDPTNLWLTIHETIGHSTELDRVLGYEANYAGTSFATLDKLNRLQLGAPMCTSPAPPGRQPLGGLRRRRRRRADGISSVTRPRRLARSADGTGRGSAAPNAFADQRPVHPAHANVAQRESKDVTRDDLLLPRRRPLHRRRQELVIDMQRVNFQLPAEFFASAEADRRSGQGRRLSVENDRFLEFDGRARRALDLMLGGAFNLRRQPRPDCAGDAWLPPHCFAGSTS